MISGIDVRLFCLWDLPKWFQAIYYSLTMWGQRPLQRTIQPSSKLSEPTETYDIYITTISFSLLFTSWVSLATSGCVSRRRPLISPEVGLVNHRYWNVSVTSAGFFGVLEVFWLVLFYGWSVFGGFKHTFWCSRILLGWVVEMTTVYSILTI